MEILIIIVLIIVFVFGRFLYVRNKQAWKISKEGSMRNKYRDLVNYLMSGDTRAEIYRLTSDSIVLELQLLEEQQYLF